MEGLNIMGKVLIVYHSMGGNTKAAAEAVARGAESVAGTKVILKQALEADVDDLVDCDAIALGTPDYFSYMAGGLKDFLDRTYYPSMGKVTDKSCLIFVSHGGGGSAVDSVKSVARSFKFREVSAAILVRGRPDERTANRLAAAGKALAEACK
jgi:flavorubredoxin